MTSEMLVLEVVTYFSSRLKTPSEKYETLGNIEVGLGESVFERTSTFWGSPKVQVEPALPAFGQSKTGGFPMSGPTPTGVGALANTQSNPQRHHIQPVQKTYHRSTWPFARPLKILVALYNLYR